MPIRSNLPPTLPIPGSATDSRGDKAGAKPAAPGPSVMNPALDFSGDAFEKNSLSPEVSKKARAVMTRYEGVVEKILNRDAMSLAEGHAPVFENADITESQIDKLKGATQDLFMDMPIGAMSPAVAKVLRGKLKKYTGKDPGELQTQSLRSMPKVGEKIAKELLGDWQDSSPATYYTAAVAAAAGIAYYGYSQGSEALKSRGLAPEVSKKFFNNHLEAGLELAWGKQGKDFRVAAGSLSANKSIDEFSNVKMGLKLGERAKLKSLNASYNFERGTSRLNLGVDHNYADSRTVVSAKGGFQATPSLSLSANTQYDFKDGGYELGLGANLRPMDNMRLSAGVSHDFGTGESKATVRGSYAVRENMDFALSGSYDSAGTSRVGVGFTWKF